jgi:hypothetical protein
MADVRETSAPRWPAREGPRSGSGPARGVPGWLGRGLAAALLALFALGGALGLWLWGKWGFLIAFDAIMAYCF